VAASVFRLVSCSGHVSRVSVAPEDDRALKNAINAWSIEEQSATSEEGAGT
jgi:hypothetical protein